MSVIINVSSGAALRSSAISRRGSIGVASEAFSGEMKLSHSAFHASTWSCHGERSRFEQTAHPCAVPGQRFHFRGVHCPVLLRRDRRAA